MDSRKFLSSEERAALETFLVERLDRDLRNATLILAAVHTGARATELLALEWTDINVETGEIVLRTLKRVKRRPGDTDADAEKRRLQSQRSNARPVVVPKLIRDALRRLKIESPERPFPLSYNRLGEIWREYRPIAKPFKALRHSFAMRAYDRTKDIRFVQKALGHESINSTMIYLEYQYTASEFKKLMRVR